MAKMRVVQVTRAGGPFELVEREIPEPARHGKGSTGIRAAQGSRLPPDSGEKHP